MRNIYRVSSTTLLTPGSYIGKRLLDAVDEYYVVKETQKTYTITHYNTPADQLKSYQMHRLAKDKYHWFDTEQEARDFVMRRAYALIDTLELRVANLRQLLADMPTDNK